MNIFFDHKNILLGDFILEFLKFKTSNFCFFRSQNSENLLKTPKNRSMLIMNIKIKIYFYFGSINKSLLYIILYNKIKNKNTIK